MIWRPKVPIGDAAPQALRGLRGGWRSPRRRLRALGPWSCGGSAPSRAANITMLTAAEMEAYERDGAVTIDGPLSEAQLDEAEAAWDRLHGHAGPVLSNDGESGEGREPYT